MAVRKVTHPSIDERRAKGMEARDQAPLSSHTKWSPAADRPDPVALLEEQNTTREPDLVPVRHGRMMVSPFTFYRGAAKIMAADLAETPVAGLKVQLCGDAHLSNFGVFASPERQLLFDLERLRRDPARAVRVRREADGGELHHRGPQQRLHQADTQAATLASVRAYREAMASSRRWARWTSGTPTWTRTSSWRADPHLAPGPKKGRSGEKKAARRQRQDAPKEEQAKEQGAETAGRREDPGEGAHPRQPAGAVQARRAGRRPVPDRQPAADGGPGARPGRHLRPVPGRGATVPCTSSSTPTGPPCRTTDATCWSGSRSSMWPARSSASAASAPGRSSCCSRAATRTIRCSCRSRRRPARCWRHHLPKSRYQHHGERVVQGQRMMQAASDIYLGWTKGGTSPPLLLAPAPRHEGLGRGRDDDPVRAQLLRRICGWTLARAHARSGDPVAIADYLGGGDAFDTSITDFSQRYADQNERDYTAFVNRTEFGAARGAIQRRLTRLGRIADVLSITGWGRW